MTGTGSELPWVYLLREGRGAEGVRVRWGETERRRVRVRWKEIESRGVRVRINYTGGLTLQNLKNGRGSSLK